MERLKRWERRYNPGSDTATHMQSLLLQAPEHELHDYLEEVSQRLQTGSDLDLARLALTVLAPVANRLNWQPLKHQLEEQAFALLHPNEYALTTKLLRRHQADRERSIRRLQYDLQQLLQTSGVGEYDIEGRTKHPYSLYKKLSKTGSIEQVYDLLALRIITTHEADCYRVLDVVHEQYEPLLGRFKDYIEQPKPNGYRSLHTTIRHGKKTIEIQIRTRDMHVQAEEGAAAHWHYDQHKDSKGYRKGVAAAAARARADTHVYVFSPDGDVYRLPAGATPLDFAFAVHTQVGFRACGAKINGSIAKLDQHLSSGDRIEVMTQPDARPRRDWLQFVVTTKARNRIKSWLKHQEHERYVAAGKYMLSDTFGSATPDGIGEVATALGCQDTEALHKALGAGDLSVERVRQQLQPPKQPTAKAETASAPKTRSDQPVIAGVSGLQYKLARCCEPGPGDAITGYITRSLGITIHRRDCSQIAHEPERLLEAEWE